MSVEQPEEMTVEAGVTVAAVETKPTRHRLTRLSLIKTRLPKTPGANVKRHRTGAAMAQFDWSKGARALFDRFAEVTIASILERVHENMYPDPRRRDLHRHVRRIDVELACAALHVQSPVRTHRVWDILGANLGRAIRPLSAKVCAAQDDAARLLYDGKRKMALPATAYANFSSVRTRAHAALQNPFNWDALCYLTVVLDQFLVDLADWAAGVATYNKRRTVMQEDLMVVLGGTPEFVALTKNELSAGYKPPLTAPLAVRHSALLQRHRLEAKQRGVAAYRPEGGPLNKRQTYRLVNQGVFAHPDYQEALASAPVLFLTGPTAPTEAIPLIETKKRKNTPSDPAPKRAKKPAATDSA